MRVGRSLPPTTCARSASSSSYMSNSSATRRIATAAFSRRRRVPFVAQVELSDCGIACLAMVLAANGRRHELHELRGVVVAGRDGVTAQAMLDAAHRFGVHGRGVRLEVD